ncbi:MAG TPA: AAA family ATPase [Actinopolymorphaceae bacterium]
MSEPMPVLWLCGPPGVGKTTLGWDVFTNLASEGVPVAYVDIDQLGISYPEPPDDPDRHRMKTRNLRAVVTNFRHAGARCVIVSGVVDPELGVDVDELGDVALTVCRLRVEREELQRRFLGRGDGREHLEGTLAEADVLDRSRFTDWCLDVTDLSVSEASRLVRDGFPDLAALGAAADRPGSRVSSIADDESAPGFADLPAFVVCGPKGVGKSTVGWEIYQQVLGAGVPASFIDLEQLGFLRPEPFGDRFAHRMKAENLSALWRTYSEAGSRFLVVVGPIECQEAAETYTDALRGMQVTVCRLHAGREELTTRILQRGKGMGPRLAGDALIGLARNRLLAIAHEAAAEAEALEHAAVGDVRVDTDGRTIAEVAAWVGEITAPR